MEGGSDVWLVDNAEDVHLVSHYLLEMLKSTEKDLKNQYTSYFKLTKEEIKAKERNQHIVQQFTTSYLNRPLECFQPHNTDRKLLPAITHPDIVYYLLFTPSPYTADDLKSYSLQSTTYL